MLDVSLYCEECEHSERVTISDINTMGFEIACPHCGTHWVFDAVGYDRPDDLKRNASVTERQT